MLNEFDLVIQLNASKTVEFLFVFDFQGKTTIILRCLERYVLNILKHFSVVDLKKKAYCVIIYNTCMQMCSVTG